MKVGRNDPCPCGSGRKYKRCCLDRESDLVRLVGECERLVDAIGELVWDRWPEDYKRALCDFYRCEPGGFGLWGPNAEERLEAELWFVCDRDLAGGATPLELALQERGGDGRAPAALASSRIRPWRIGSTGSTGRLEANCALTDAPATLELTRAPAGDAAPGRTIVARSVPLGERRFGLLGRVPVVASEVEEDFRELLGRLPDTDPDSLLQSHGGTLVSAAWCWPEERFHTFEGEPCTDAICAWELRDLDATIAALNDHRSLEPVGLEERDEPEVESWHLLAPTARPVEPAREVGVRWRLCEDDTFEPRRLARVDVDPYDDRLWLHASSPKRLERAERGIRRLVGSLLGARYVHEDGRLDASMRWQRERWEKLATTSLSAGVLRELEHAA